MKFIRSICLILSFILLTGAFGFAAHATDFDAAVTSGCHSVDAKKPLMSDEKLLETSKAVFVYERNSDTLVYGYNADEKIYPSSMVKIMTALVALDRGELSETVEVTRNALSYVAIGSVSAGLKNGELISLEDLLYCMLTASANDASVVIAEHIGGSQERFVMLMNKKAEELGCTGTNFTNAHGLHDENNYTTIRDVCKILDAALDNETFKTMFQTEKHTVPATNKCEERQLVTTNRMMTAAENDRYLDERVTGGKTGATDQAGRCLAVTAEQNGMELIAIVMGAKPTYEIDGIALKTHGSFEEMAVLLDHTFSQYEYRQVFYAGQAVSQYPVTNGDTNVVLAPVKTMSTVLPVNLDPNQLSWVYGDLTGSTQAPIAQGQNMSTLQVWYGSTCVAQTDLVAMNPVPLYSDQAADDDAHKIPVEETSILSTVIWVIVGIVVFALLVWFGVRWIRKTLQKKRRMRRRREQRRRGNA